MKFLLNQCKAISLLTVSMLIFLLSCSDKDLQSEPTSPVSPKADFNYSGIQKAGEEIHFDNLSVDATSFNWNFGNGTTSSKKDPGKIIYAQAGIYEVVLVAINGNQRNLIKKSILIAQDNQPVSHFSYTFKDGKNYAPAKLILKNESVNADFYEWHINGMLRNEREPDNIYFNAPGDYIIKLTASQSGRKSAVYEQVVTVTANPNPVAHFVMPYHPYPYQVGEDIQVVNQSKNSDQWQWTFESGNPAQSNEEHPSVKFTTPGNHKITLVAKKGNLVSQAMVITLKINP